MKYLGIDYGAKRVGVSISDSEGRVAFPYRVLPNDHLLVRELAKLAEKEGIKEIVIGDSKDFKGVENPVMKGARDTVDQIRRHTGAEIHFEPEFFTTQEAKRSTGKESLDASAAALILQSFLDKRNAEA